LCDFWTFDECLLREKILRLQAKTLAEIMGQAWPPPTSFLFLAELSNAVDLKNPRPAPPDNGAIEEKQRLPAHTTSGLDQRCPSLPYMRGFD